MGTTQRCKVWIMAAGAAGVCTLAHIAPAAGGLAPRSTPVCDSALNFAARAVTVPPVIHYLNGAFPMKTRIASLVLSSTLVALMAAMASGCSKPADSTGQPAPSTSVGTEIDDSVLTTRVKSVLLADADVKSFEFKVETRKGVVMLSGFVDNQAQIDRAESLTRAVSGVTGIQNNVTLKVGGTTVGNQVDDGIVTTKVKAALMSDEAVKSTDISVETRKGEVQLSGFVSNQGQMDRAQVLARGVEGVTSVTNQMSLKK
jgi:hyperosmotically inducible protein